MKFNRLSQNGRIPLTSVSKYIFDPADLPPAVKYQKLFENLPQLEEHIPKTGICPTSRNSLLKALVYKSLTRFPFLSDVTFELNNNSSMSQALSFNPLASAPSVERFSSFLHDTKNHELKALHQQLVHALIEAGVIAGKSIAIDSCPIVIPLKENNLKLLWQTDLIKPEGLPVILMLAEVFRFITRPRSKKKFDISGGIEIM